MTAVIWAGAGNASDALFLAAVIVAAIGIALRMVGRDADPTLASAAVLLLALGLLAL